MESTVVVNENTSEVTVIIDTVGPNLYPVVDFLNKLELNYNRFEEAVNNIYTNSARYLNQEQIQQLALIQTLSSGWEETYTEVNTIQQDLSTTWQNTSDYVAVGIVDGGFF